MIVIYNKILPLKGYIAINILGVLFARKEFNPLRGWMINHERIHTRQMIEMFFIFFYVWYILEFMFRIIQYRQIKYAYMNISFEREAYQHQYDLNYLEDRKFLSFIKYLK